MSDIEENDRQGSARTDTKHSGGGAQFDIGGSTDSDSTHDDKS